MYSSLFLLRPCPEGFYEITCVITYQPSKIFWICGILGFFCLWPLWIVNLFYFFVDPLPIYQAALDGIDLQSQAIGG